MNNLSVKLSTLFYICIGVILGITADQHLTIKQDYSSPLEVDSLELTTIGSN